MTMWDDARRAIEALLAGKTDGTFGSYALVTGSFADQPSVELRYKYAGWAVAIEVGCLVWWRSYLDKDGHGMACAALAEVLGIELPTNPAAHDHAVSVVLGPLGLAAIRAYAATQTPTVVDTEGAEANSAGD